MANRTAIMSLRIISDAKQAAAGLNTAANSVGGFIKKAAGAAAVAVGMKKLIDYGREAVSMAGDLEQSVGAIDTVFKGNADQMHAWAKSAQNDVGLTANEYNELGTLIGTQLKNGGTAMDQLAPKTNKLIGLGADLSSMFGGTSKEAVEALSSALKGERDPIERYGVSLNQAKIDAEAAALGFKKVGGSLSDEANQAATLSLIMKQTADAHGNFAKEANTLQGQQQRMTAGWKNIQTTLGTLLLPALTALYAFINTNILPVFAKWADSMANGGVGEAFGALGQKIAPFIATIGSMFAEIAPMFAPLIGQFLELATSVSPLALVMQVLQPILPVVAAAIVQLASVISNLLAAVLPLASTLLSQLLPVFANLAGSVLPPLIRAFMSLVTAIMPLVNVLIANLAPILTMLATTLVPTLSAAIVGIVSAVQPVLDILLGALIPVIQSLLPIVTQIFGGISTFITGAMQVISGIIQVVSGIITGDWSATWNGIKSIFEGIWNMIKGIVTTAINLVLGIIKGVLGIIQSVWSAGWNAVSTVVSGIWQNIKSAAGDFFGSLPNFIVSSLGDLGNLLVGAGRAIIDGFLGGLKAAWEKGKEFIGGIGSWIAANKGPISYDKRLLKPAGAAIMGGLVKSMRAAMPELEKTVKEATGTILGLNANPQVKIGASSSVGSANRVSTAGARIINIKVSGVVGDKIGLARYLKQLIENEEEVTGTNGN